MYQESAKQHFILFLISPVLGLVYAIKTGSRSVIRWSLFVFTVIYGSLFSPSFLGDGARHWQNVYVHYQYLDFSAWWKELILILSFNPSDLTGDDVYIHTISYFIGGILNMPGLFFVGVAIVYAYFYSGFIVKVLSFANWQTGLNKFYFYFFVILLLLWKQPYDMQTVRSWTSMWVLLYSIISYHESKHWKYLVLVLTVPLFHIGFTTIAFPIWVVLYSGYRNPKIYFYIFIFSVFSSTVLENYNIASIVSSQSQLGKDKTDAYYHSEEERAENAENYQEELKGTAFYNQYVGYGFHRKSLTAIIIFVYFILRKRGFGEIENTLFSYGLAMASFSNFFISFFAIHNRGWHTAAILILSLLVIFLSKQNLRSMSFSFLKVRLPLTLLVLALSPFALYSLSNLIRFTSPYIFLMPAVSWINPDVAIGLRQVVGLFL
jgi:hypothetical protein